MISRRFRLAARVAAVVSLSSGFAQDAVARGVRVRGDARLEARLGSLSASGSREVEVSLTDETGAPLPAMWLDLQPRGFSLRGSARCAGTGGDSLVPRANAVRVKTTELGRACLTLPKSATSGRLELRFGGDALHGAADASLAIDEGAQQRVGVTLRFTERSVTLRSESKVLALTAELREHGESSGVIERASVELVDSEQHRLARETTDAEGTVRFEVDSHALAAGGASDLEARFGGDDNHDKAAATITVVRQLRVSLALDSAPMSVSPGDDVEATIRAVAAHTTIEHGVVEVRRNGLTLVSAPLRAGEAKLSIPTPSEARGEVTFEAHFVPSAPHLIPGQPLVWSVRAETPGWRSRLSVASLVIAAAAVVFSSWRRSRLAAAPLERPSILEPGIHVAAEARRAGRFLGRVLDAHDNRPIAGAIVRVRRPALDGDGLLQEILTDSLGTFEFTTDVATTRELVLDVRAEDYVPESKSLPSGGRLTVALITRRRALLQRFVAWAKRTGATRERRGEPTPAEVRATLRDIPGAVTWASEVEQAAFGPDRLDVATDERLHAEEPR
ncbi:MAG: hypothetical protein FJ095_05460 [Deltaproteobacteria bacterium]|nr:hypothetical protein [Deltaproteobacteria bacterium]